METITTRHNCYLSVSVLYNSFYEKVSSYVSSLPPYAPG